MLLFWAFVKNHPLLGRREYDLNVLTRADQLRLWGPEALFIFDPKNSSNEPVPGYNDGALTYWPIYPEFLRQLFTRAFTDGIHDPQHGRVFENEWRDAMAQLRDAVVTCPHCGGESFSDEGKRQNCWRCGTALAAPRRVVLPNATVVMEEGAALYPHHLDHALLPDSSKPIARVIRRHKERGDLIGLENGTNEAWRVILPHGEERTVEPRSCVGIHPQVQILFGKAKAQIV